MSIRYKKVRTINEFIDAIRLRVDVFINEQGFAPGWEPDEEDKNSQQFIATVNKKVVATARFRKIRNGIKIERMATKKEYRGKGIGKGLLVFMLKEIKKEKPKRIYVASQLRAKQFYEECGFKVVSSPVKKYGVKHVEMIY
jgi:predicted GNAT family N-acyltransferase